MFRFLGMLLLLGFALPLHADFYQDLNQLAADDQDAARLKAQNILEGNPDQDPDAWIPAWIFLWDIKKLRPEQDNPALLPKLVALAQARNQAEWVLRLQYAEDPAAGDFVERAAAAGMFRFVAQLLNKQAFDAYYAGDMKLCLSQIQKAFALLEKKVPHDDLQMLETKGNMANYLEYTGESAKAEDIYHDVIASYRRLAKRWALADSMANFSLLLMHQSRFPEAEKNLGEVMSLGLSLHSALLQGRAHKSLAFAWAQQKRFKPAIQAYLKALALMVEAGEDPVGIADTQRILADAYVADQQWERALRALDQAASEPQAMQDKDWERTLQETRVVALAGLGKIAEALQASKRINQLLVKILEEEKQREISKLKVSLGLQIEEQKNDLLKEQNKLQHEKLHDAEVLRRFFIGLIGLAALAILLLLFTLRQTLRAKRSRERMHRILEHIEEGILSIGAGMRVQADFSPYLKRLLVASAAHENIFMRLLHNSDLTGDEQATLIAILQACIGENPIAWDLNHPQLPREISLHQGQQHLHLDWQPVYHEHKTIDSVLLTVRDVTDRKRLQIEVDEARARSLRLEQRLGDVLQWDARRAQTFVAEADQLFEAVRTHWTRHHEHLEVAHSLHTLKGLARSFGFKDMSALIHEMEECLGEDGWLERLRQMLEEYATLIHRVFPVDSVAASSTLLDCVAAQLPAVRTMLERAGIELGRIAVIDEIRAWPHAWLDAVRVFCLHGLTNAADHGFILPRRRGENVSPVAQICIQARMMESGLELELSDNGRGLDWDRLKTLADRLHFQPAAAQTLADVVFLEGASTAELVTRSSGRGMGMAAVRAAMEQVAGEVHLLANGNGPGSRLVATFPADTFRQFKGRIDSGF